MSTQRATSCCDCGAVIDVTPTDSAWDGKASLLPDRAQHDPAWWSVGEHTRQQRRRDSRARHVGRSRTNYPWRVKQAAVARIRAGETIRMLADDLDLPYYKRKA